MYDTFSRLEQKTVRILRMFPFHNTGQMSLYSSLVRPVLFRLPPELAHDIAMRALSLGLAPRAPWRGKDLSVQKCGLTFPNPVGLAAGVDKTGILAARMADYGFGFTEVGTIVPLAQPGNPSPRMFRIPDHRAVINRMGFNSPGMEVCRANLTRRLPTIPLGINMGKNKNTPAEEAHLDYGKVYDRFADIGDYFVVNVSSPNTPGLRDLQDAAALERIFQELAQRGAMAKPVLLKLSPDLDPEAVRQAVQVANRFRLAGFIATNTTIQRPSVGSAGEESGGLSGRPLRELANATIEVIAKAKSADQLLIGVGGIDSAETAQEKFDLGCDLVQVYTGLVYEGFDLVHTILNGLALRR